VTRRGVLRWLRKDYSGHDLVGRVDFPRYNGVLVEMVATEGYIVILSARLPDALGSGERVNVEGRVRVRGRSERGVFRALRRAYIEFIVHEVDEGIRFDGRRVFDPHDAGNWTPEFTDLQRAHYPRKRKGAA
jgi:hypothetical protein